jgi:hypothetical protein
MTSHDPEGADMSIKHLNQIELARRWNISHRTLERWRWKREGPPFIKLSGWIVYRLEHVLAFETEHLSTSELRADDAKAITSTRTLAWR